MAVRIAADSRRATGSSNSRNCQSCVTSSVAYVDVEDLYEVKEGSTRSRRLEVSEM